MSRPICFALMPYGRKSTVAPEGTRAPGAVDFDRLWNAAFRPAIERAGYEPVRADENPGSLVLLDLLERVTLSDLVLVDVSLPSPILYYAIGIRHAAKQVGCIITAPNWSRPSFDIDQMRQIRYPLPAEMISDETASEIAHIFTSAMPLLALATSPFFQAFPSYPAIDTRRTPFRSRFEELSRFQAEVTALRDVTKDDRRQRALELREKYYSGGSIAPALAMGLISTLSDWTDFRTTLDFIETLPNELKNSPPIKEQRLLAISRSGDHDNAIAALRELIHISGDTSERRGLLGGRYKKRWAQTKDPLDLDLAIAEYEAGMKLDLNDYYPSSNLLSLYRIRNRDGDDDRARVTAAVVLTACERAKSRGSLDEWLNPTLLGAAFDAGDVAKVRELVKTIQMDGPGLWKLGSTVSDFRSKAELHEEPRRSELRAVAALLGELI